MRARLRVADAHLGLHREELVQVVEHEQCGTVPYRGVAPVGVEELQRADGLVDELGAVDVDDVWTL